MSQTVREGKVYKKEQFWYSNMESEIKVLAKNKKCGRNENRRFIDITITLSAQA